MHGEYEVVPVAERLFEAKITDVFHYGFTIEATIDNKPLRGLLFSYKPGFAHAAHNYVSRFDYHSMWDLSLCSLPQVSLVQLFEWRLFKKVLIGMESVCSV